MDESEVTEPASVEMTSKKGLHKASTTSRFYRPEKVDHRVESFIASTTCSCQDKNAKDKIRQSRHLPLWAWYIIAKCNGIPLTGRSKPIFGTLLHALTFSGALTYALSYTWFAVYDIISPNTPKDIPGGSVSILLVYFWCGFGYYCKDLSSRLFLHPRFLKDIRMHARTVFKVNGALFAFILGLLFTVANVIESLDWFANSYCEKIELEDIVCQVMSVSSIVMSVFTLIWHSLVSFVFMSVCRTHTIGVRRFIKEIECDASLTERHLSMTHKIVPHSEDDIWQESLWLAEEDGGEEYVSYTTKSKLAMSVSKKDINPQLPHPASNEIPLAQPQEISVLFSPINDLIESSNENDWIPEYNRNQHSEDRAFIPVRRSLKVSKSLPEDSTTTSHTMTNAELMHHFWKLNCRLRFSSYALQRWYACFVSLVLLRCSTYLVHWLGHAASICDILQFTLPLVMLVVLSTAIAEVNFDGQRVPCCIYPTEQRIKPLQYMALNPLQISIYGFGMTHGTIVTVVFAVLVGFLTKVIITEVTG